MRIAHVVTYVSPDGAFGGPSRVALGQAAALAERGHDVTVFAGAPADLAGTAMDEGYTLRTFPAWRIAPGGGFAAMCSPRLIRALRAELSTFDVVHLHLARDLVTLPAALATRAAGIPYVVQTHGMVDASKRWLAKPVDSLATRPALRGARAVLVLTDQEERDIRGVQPAATVLGIGNGIRVGALPPYGNRRNLVLFLARLHARKRPVAFVEMAAALSDRFPETEFVLVGPDEGEAGSTQAAIERLNLQGRVKWVGAASPDATDAWIASARAYVLPSFGEVFPMTILEALRAGTPVITTNSLGIAADCEEYGAALITEGSPSELAAAVARVLSSPELAGDLRLGGARYLRDELDVSRVAERLEEIYSAR